MKMTDNQSLLADYAATGSEPAFRELLTNYIGLVYSAAVRLVGGDTHLAQDVAQTVFIDLARKARTLPKDVMLGGWLHRHTLFVAATIMRGERRRQLRERQAVEMNALQDHTEANLAQVAPILSRYAMLQTGKLTDIPNGEYLVAETAPPVDNEYDTIHRIGMSDVTTRTINQVEDAIQQAGIQFAQDNNGLLPTNPAQLAPYLKQQIEVPKIQEMLSRVPPGVTTLDQLRSVMGR